MKNKRKDGLFFNGSKFVSKTNFFAFLLEKSNKKFYKALFANLIILHRIYIPCARSFLSLF